MQWSLIVPSRSLEESLGSLRRHSEQRQVFLNGHLGYKHRQLKIIDGKPMINYDCMLNCCHAFFFFYSAVSLVI